MGAGRDPLARGRCAHRHPDFLGELQRHARRCRHGGPQSGRHQAVATAVRPSYLLLHVVVGGNLPGQPPADSHFPAELVVDCLRVHRPAVGYGAALPCCRVGRASGHTKKPTQPPNRRQIGTQDRSGQEGGGRKNTRSETSVAQSPRPTMSRSVRPHRPATQQRLGQAPEPGAARRVDAAAFLATGGTAGTSASTSASTSDDTPGSTSTGTSTGTSPAGHSSAALPAPGPYQAPRPAQATSLAAALNAVMAAGVHGLCFSPNLDGQNPGTQITEARIHARLQVLAPHTRWQPTFLRLGGDALIPRIARQLGCKTLVGAWLGTDAAINQREIDAVIAIARASHADIVALGNGLLLREDRDEATLLAAVAPVQQAVPGVPVGTVEACDLVELDPRITAACGVLRCNCDPFWQGCPLEHAIACMHSMVQRVEAVVAGKPVLASETGWPDQRSAFFGALLPTRGAMRQFVDTQAWAQQHNIPVAYFPAFDEGGMVAPRVTWAPAGACGTGTARPNSPAGPDLPPQCHQSLT